VLVAYITLKAINTDSYNYEEKEGCEGVFCVRCVTQWFRGGLWLVGLSYLSNERLST
jgi:hypothetical protein